MPRMPRRSARSIALAQRARDEASRSARNFLSCAGAFEDEMRGLTYAICIRCRKRTGNSDLRRDLCTYCQRARINAFAPENEMDFGEIPAQLRDLTMIEEVLIARVHPVVSLFKIRGQQRAYSGHVMNFIQHVEQVAARLPHDPRNLNSIVLLNRETPQGLIQFRVRSARVRDALAWLKTNNQYYHDIIIDNDVIANLPIDGDVSHLLPNLLAEEPRDGSDADTGEPNNIIERSCFPSVPVVNLPQVIERNLRQVANDQDEDIFEAGDWPDLENNPLNEFSSEGMICKAFPVLFPYGRGDLRAPRVQTITKHNYFKYLMQYHDGRFANDPRFPYYAYNSLARWDALNCGNVYVRRNRLEGVSAHDMLEMANDPDFDLASSIMYYGSNLRGTRSYWKQRCSELIQMVRQLGTPTIFFTLSAADYHWPDLFKILSPNVNPNSLDEKQRATLMHDNPATVAWFFEKRCDIFMKLFMTKFFAVKDYWYRFEWQHRGSPHIHGLLWLEDAPSCSDIDSLSHECRAAIVQYFDGLVSACINQRSIILPPANPCRRRFTDLNQAEKESDLDRLLSAVQRHSRCGPYCLRRKRNSRQMSCRFGFPIELEESSALRLDSGSWKFIPKRNDSLLQRYNRFVTQIWRGNTDFSAITSHDAVINYISKYASKGEHSSEAMSEVLRRLITRNDDETPASTLIRQLLISSVAERNFSAQEVMHLLMGWPLYHSSRSTIVLSLREDWQRLGPVPSSSLLSHYSGRDDSLADVSLYYFAKNYYRSGGRTVRRRRECVVRVVPFLKLTDDLNMNEEFYKLQCKLHVPWRGDFDSLRLQNESWGEIYLANLGLIDDSDAFAGELPHAPEELEFEDEPANPANMVRDAAMVAARLRPNSQQPEDPLGHRPIDEAFYWHDLSMMSFNEDAVQDFLRSYRAAPQVPGARDQTIGYELMSHAQKQILDILYRQIEDPQISTKRVLVQGKAGTGKSAVIKAMCHALDERQHNYPEERNGYQILAPTGVAAVNIDGKTIHSFLKIPVNGQILPLNGDNLRRFQLQFTRLRFIIIDEYSMIGFRLLHKIHRRLCEASGSAAEPFGGYVVYLLGDLRQLPPVKDTAVYMEPSDDFSRFGLRLINSFQTRIILTVCHRQNADQENFKRILDGIATGSVTQAGWQLLMSRRRAISPSNLESFRDSISLFPTNVQVTEHNTRILSLNRNPVAIVDAMHNNATARQGSEEHSQGLSRKLYLSIGCRVMLRKNLCTERGLVNGALGTVRDIVYNVDQRPPSFPNLILVEFDNYSGPYIIENYFPILPIEVTWREQSVDCCRKQFPLSLAYALTIHKAQGLTLEKATIDIGDREMAPGLSYVALSRVRKLENILFINSFNFSRLSMIGQMKYVIERERFLRTMESSD